MPRTAQYLEKAFPVRVLVLLVAMGAVALLLSTWPKSESGPWGCVMTRPEDGPGRIPNPSVLPACEGAKVPLARFKYKCGGSRPYELWFLNNQTGEHLPPKCATRDEWRRWNRRYDAIINHRQKPNHVQLLPAS